MNVAVQSEFTGSGQMAFYAGLEFRNRERGGALKFLPMNGLHEMVLDESPILRGLDLCIGSLVSDRWLSERSLKDLPWINLGQLSRIRSVPTVGVDYCRVAQRAAEAFRASGVSRVYLAAARGQWRALELARGLKESCAENGLEPAEEVLRPDQLALSRWLSESKFDGSQGVLCVNDTVARRVVEIAHALGLGVGRDIKVLGIGNDPEASLLSPIPIASVPIPFNAIGRAVVDCAMEILEASTDGAVRSLFLDPESAISRESLGVSRVVEDCVDRAMVLMERNIRVPYGIDELARELGVSRRKLELAFKRGGLGAPASEWLSLRLSEAKRLLLQTDWSILEIAARTGFASQQRFSQVFRQRFGLSATQWRQGERNM